MLERGRMRLQCPGSCLPQIGHITFSEGLLRTEDGQWVFFPPVNTQYCVRSTP